MFIPCLARLDPTCLAGEIWGFGHSISWESKHHGYTIPQIRQRNGFVYGHLEILEFENGDILLQNDHE